MEETHHGLRVESSCDPDRPGQLEGMNRRNQRIQIEMQSIKSRETRMVLDVFRLETPEGGGTWPTTRGDSEETRGEMRYPMKCSPSAVNK